MSTSPSDGPIDVVAFEAANSRAYLKAVFDAWGEGKTVMVLPAGAGKRKVPGVYVQKRSSFSDDPGWFEAVLPERPGDERGLIAFSSGTTGKPKAILIRHEALQDVVARINSAMDVDSTIREYLGVPVTYSFGFGRARAVAQAGGAVFLPENGFDPSEINRMLEAGEINSVSAVPTLWRVLLANKGIVSPKAAGNLEWAEIGSQWMSADEKRELRQLFPNATIVQHYGLTEASRSTLLNISAAPDDKLESVGRADTLVAIDQEGRIKVRGPHLAEGLVSGAGVKPLVDDEGWFTTSDKGKIDDGWLYYEGRVDELINCGGLKIDPTSFEQTVNTELGVPGAVAVGKAVDELRGEKVLVAYSQDADVESERLAEVINAAVEKYGLVGSASVEVRQVASIPMTDTGKVKRAELADLPDLSKPQETFKTPAVEAGASGDLISLWGEILGLDDVPTDKSFYDLGGDSLSALTAIVKMESLGIDAETARGIFEGKTIADMADDEVPPPPARAPKIIGHQDQTEEKERSKSISPLSLAEMVNSVHAARGVLVLWVVVVHWFPAFLTRIGDGSLWLYETLIPAWRFGTPGFAMVFGMGIGALGLHYYRSNPEMFRKSTRFNTKLIVSGVLLLGLGKFLIVLAEGKLGDRIAMSGLFYSAITYYGLAMLSLPLLVRLLVIGSNRLLTIAIVGAASMLIHELLVAMFASAQPKAVLEFVKITFTAKYGYFRMTGFVMVGVAIGWLFRRHHQDEGVIRDMVLYGLVSVAVGIVGVFQTGSETARTDFGLVHIWHLAFYAGCALLVLSGFAQINRAGGVRMQPVKFVNVFAITSGILALPIFVGHELIWTLKQLSDALGIPDAIGLAVLLTVFLGGMFMAYRRLMRFF